ncbi:MAG: hypothetical protein R2932_47115 [Caldilineaceae bacterium]
MFSCEAPVWSSQWIIFTDWQEALVATVGAILLLLLIIWWRQQSHQWFRITVATLLIAVIMAIGSYYFFEVPVYYANCPAGCTGWRGFPLPYALIALNHVAYLAPGDFAMNVLTLWLLWLAASVLWRILSIAVHWEQRSWRSQLLLIITAMILPWALTPRFISPPQPTLRGEEERLAINARRAAEFTYQITGVWVQRLAIEDVRILDPDADPTLESVNRVGGQVCLRGYTYFFIPWHRYRIDLDGIGRTRCGWWSCRW